jgi:hypothetical protein
MKRLFLLAVLLLSVSLTFALAQGTQPSKSVSQTQSSQLPPGWEKAGSNPLDYDIYPDTAVRHGGKASANIKAKESTARDGFATMMQAIKADNYRGQRIRLSGYLKTENVPEYAGLWMRLDAADPTNLLGFDNMENRPVKGTTDWKRYEIVLDVPNETDLIAFGINLSGGGQIWADDLKIEVVGKDVVLTNMTYSAEQQAEMKKQLEDFRTQNPEEYNRRMQRRLENKKTKPVQGVNLDFETLK